MKQRTLSALAALAFGSPFFASMTLTTAITLMTLTTPIYATGTISGFVWDDLNTNGIQDAGEPGLDSAWVLLIDAGGNQVGSAYTDANGLYSFDSVTAGTYVVRFANPGGVWQTLQDQGGNDAVDSDADPLGFTDSFNLGDGQTLDFDAGFTSVPQGCFTPVTITVSAIACDDNGTPDPDDDTFTFAITATGGTGAWGWDLLPNLMMIPYGIPYTFGPYQIVNGAVTLTINDHDNPSCIATVTVNPPTPCSSPVPPDSSDINLICANNITATVPSGATGAIVTFSNPTVTTTCPGGAATVTQIQGPVSGSTFPVGTTDVCFAAVDTCGNADTCCFKVTVVLSPSPNPPCDEKVIGCIKYELLGITINQAQEKTYQIRVTNNCTNKLIYAAFQLPNGIVAVAPPNNSVYTAPSGREYDVRNPNFSPFYSVRFKSVMDSIANGESDIFEYTLPPQSDPDYIHVIVRVYPKIFYEAYLNTFDCVPVFTPSQMQLVDLETEEIKVDEKKSDEAKKAQHLSIYPNPSSGVVSADLSPWKGQKVQLSLLNSQGHLLQTLSTEATGHPFPMDVANDLPNGLYFLEAIPADGARQVQRFMLLR